MLVVADTSPLNYLVLIRHEAVLPALYTQVVIPPAVVSDLEQFRTPEPVRAWMARPPAWLDVRAPRQALDAERYPRLGVGEREAIMLAQELGAALLLIDDAEGRMVAERHHLAAMGTLGILETASQRGLIDLPEALERLQATTFRARQELFEALLARDAARKRPH